MKSFYNFNDSFNDGGSNMKKIKAGVVIVAAGSGKRMKSKRAKQFIEIKNKPIAAYTIEKFEDAESVDEIVIVTGEEDIVYFQNEIIKRYGFKKVKAVVKGGSERQYSVYCGLKEIDSGTDVVLIHDGVRPFVKTEEIEHIAEKTMEYGACVLGVKVKDTIKICDEAGNVTNTPKRELLWAAHTPQSFKYNIIMKAHKKAYEDGFLGTDDSMLAERLGVKIKMLEGSYENIKITTPEDLLTAERIICAAAKQ